MTHDQLLPAEITHATAVTRAPSIQTRAQANLVSAYRSKIAQEPDGLSWSITDRDAPRGKDLEALRARRHELTTFPPASAQQIGAKVAQLFLRFPSTAKGSQEMVAAYTRDLSRFPLWAIVRGLTSIVAGGALRSTEFPPTSRDVQKAVRAVLQPVLDEAADIARILDAEVVAAPKPLSADARKAIADAARAMMREHTPPEDPQIKRDTRLPSRFDDAKAVTVEETPTLSPAALATLGLQPQGDGR